MKLNILSRVDKLEQLTVELSKSVMLLIDKRVEEEHKIGYVIDGNGKACTIIRIDFSGGDCAHWALVLYRNRTIETVVMRWLGGLTRYTDKETFFDPSMKLEGEKYDL